MLEARNIAIGWASQPILSQINLRLSEGEILGLSAPSGTGKTSLARVLAGLSLPLRGEVWLDGKPCTKTTKLQIQYLDQDPLLAMNPRWKIGRILAEAGPVASHDIAGFDIASDWLGRYPHELSGGQLQRIAILRALSIKPRFLLADEITAALDPISQAKIWKSLREICKKRCIGILAISHDQALLKAICDARMTLSSAALSQSRDVIAQPQPKAARLPPKSADADVLY